MHFINVTIDYFFYFEIIDSDDNILDYTLNVTLSSIMHECDSHTLPNIFNLSITDTDSIHNRQHN